MFDFNDVVREGDGECFLDLYKFVFLFYYSEGCIKYVYIVLFYLVKVVVVFFEFEVYRFKWNWFYNKYGGKGNNILLDFKKE